MPNTDKIQNPESQPGEATRQARVAEVLPLVRELRNPFSPALVTFCGSRGIGRSTILIYLEQRLPELPDVVLLGKWDFRILQPGGIARQIREHWSSLSEGKTGIILLDHLDEPLRHPEQELAFFEFENDILSEVVTRQDTLVVASTSIELRHWEDPEVNRRHKAYRLLPLTEVEAADAVQPHNLDVKQAMRITFGHPQVLKWWLEDPSLGEAEIAARSAQFFLEDLMEHDRQTALAAAVLPQFNSYLLLKALDEEITQASQVIVLDQIHRMIGYGLANWDADYGCYRFCDSAVRRLLARHQLHANPGRSEAIHRMAGEFFRGEAKGAAFLHRHLVSAIYHTIYEYRDLGPQDAGSRCLDWIDDVQMYWLTARWEKVIPAWLDGAGEPAVRDEIETLIGNEHFIKISNRLYALEERLKVTLEENL